MTKQSFQETIDYGTKLLHITSDVVLDNKIAFEKDLGEVKKLSMQKLEKLMINSLTNRVDVVGVAIPASVHIGEVFQRKGAKHVLCFASNPKISQRLAEEEDELI